MKDKSVFYMIKDKKVSRDHQQIKLWKSQAKADMRARKQNEYCGDDRYYAVPVEVKEINESIDI